MLQYSVAISAMAVLTATSGHIMHAVPKAKAAVCCPFFGSGCVNSDIDHTQDAAFVATSTCPCDSDKWNRSQSGSQLSGIVSNGVSLVKACLRSLHHTMAFDGHLRLGKDAFIS